MSAGVGGVTLREQIARCMVPWCPLLEKREKGAPHSFSGYKQWSSYTAAGEGATRHL
jgi:hypothetical protein